MNRFLLPLLLMLFSVPLFCQVGINTNDPSPASVLDVNSTNGVSYGGFLPPRVNTAQRDAIAVSADDDGLMIYLIEGSERCVQIYDAVLDVWDNVYCMPVNDKPVATISYTGWTIEGQTLTASYTYSDTENDPQDVAATTANFQWVTATDVDGTNITPIAGATSSTFVVTTAQNGFFIAVQIIPEATSGMSPGNVAISDWDGPVTGNAAPEANNVVINGAFAENQTLTADFDYSDFESDAEGTHTYRWFRATDASGAGATAIPSATSITYDLDDTYMNLYIAVEVTPVASAGTLIGAPVMSAWGGPVTPPAAFASDLFISESIEGTYKVIEISNFTGTTINLENYKLKTYANGATTVNNTCTLTNVDLAHGESYVITNNMVVPNADRNYSWSFNGNDAVELTDPSNNPIDVIGEIGNNAYFNEDITLIRIPGSGPNTVFDPAEWTEVGSGSDTSNLGSHTYN
ncbi:MAG TPA: lamin tail domain-containing protein [Salinimicrobium sp.]|nr:lamin tail domain-containing protein [Salinimicrobium sp.]